MKKVYLNPLTVYDFLYEKIYDCSDLDLIDHNHTFYDIIDDLIKIKNIGVSKEEYDLENIEVHRANIYLDDESSVENSFIGLYFVSGTGFDISKEINKTKKCLEDNVLEFSIGETTFKPFEKFLVIPAIEPNHRYDIIVFRDFLAYALDNYEPVHLENGKLTVNPKNFDIHNFVIGNLGTTIPYFIVSEIINLTIETERLDFLSIHFKGDQYLLHIVAYFKYMQKVRNWNIAETKKFILQLSIDMNNPSILTDADYKDIVTNDKKLIKTIEEVLNIDDEIKKSYLKYGILLYKITRNIINNQDTNNNIKLVK